MRWPGLAVLVALDGISSLPGPGDVYPPEQGRPKNMRSCRFNADSVLPWVLGVWDTRLQLYIGIGSMLTYITFITSCRQYHESHNNEYRAIGQFIWDASRPADPCMQEAMISSIIRHPKCINDPKVATFFDFAVMKLENAFDISGYTYPTIYFPNTAYEFVIGVQYINIIPRTKGCILPYFRDQKKQPPIFDFEMDVESIPFRSQCVSLLCEKNPPDPRFSEMCIDRFRKRAKATMLCVKNTYRNHISIPLGDNHMYWYAGTPLVCNGSTFGIAAQPKIRSSFRYDSDDFHLVLTFLRVWPWLTELMTIHSAPWVSTIHVEDMQLVPVEYDEPYREPIDGEGMVPHSDAPALEIIVFSYFFIIFICFYDQS